MFRLKLPACPLNTVAHRLEMTDAMGRQPRRAPFWADVKADVKWSYPGPRREWPHGFTSVTK